MVTIQGGHSTTGSVDNFQNLFSAGQVITAEFAYHVLPQTVDLYIDGYPVTIGLPILHKGESGNIAAPVVTYAQLIFRNQNSAGAYFDSFEVNTLPVDIR